MFYGIPDLTTFVIGTIFIVLLPGPNSLYVVALASRQGIAAGYRGAFGIFAGDAILMLLSATGAASFWRSLPALFWVIKLAGAAYLAWIGFCLLRESVRGWRGRSAGIEPTGTALRFDGARPFRKALVISLMNPKAILFFVSFFVQFVDPGYAHPELSFLILGGIVQLCSALYLSMLIFGGAGLARHFRARRRLSAAATGSVGGLFIGFGAKLASATLS